MLGTKMSGMNSFCAGASACACAFRANNSNVVGIAMAMLVFMCVIGILLLFGNGVIRGALLYIPMLILLLTPYKTKSSQARN